ncbi:hypothetical protein ATK30_1963 [Amycolatopsis echigonensis]|uniref:Uncharacterized protein n=1 Tax=Amycolatopsis echigonensis TaxID=2576905 RepID=A0A2N3WBE3_9PSEU|nr:hypothetical protein ATK30_1963 [Amycolatopsis niigatensis]
MRFPATATAPIPNASAARRASTRRAFPAHRHSSCAQTTPHRAHPKHTATGPTASPNTNPTPRTPQPQNAIPPPPPPRRSPTPPEHVSRKPRPNPACLPGAPAVALRTHDPTPDPLHAKHTANQTPGSPNTNRALRTPNSKARFPATAAPPIPDPERISRKPGARPSPPTPSTNASDAPLPPRANPRPPPRHARTGQPFSRGFRSSSVDRPAASRVARADAHDPPGEPPEKAKPQDNGCLHATLPVPQALSRVFRPVKESGDAAPSPTCRLPDTATKKAGPDWTCEVYG